MLPYIPYSFLEVSHSVHPILKGRGLSSIFWKRGYLFLFLFFSPPFLFWSIYLSTHLLYLYHLSSRIIFPCLYPTIRDLNTSMKMWYYHLPYFFGSYYKDWHKLSIFIYITQHSSGTNLMVGMRIHSWWFPSCDQHPALSTVFGGISKGSVLVH